MQQQLPASLCDQATTHIHHATQFCLSTPCSVLQTAMLPHMEAMLAVVVVEAATKAVQQRQPQLAGQLIMRRRMRGWVARY